VDFFTFMVCLQGLDSMVVVRSWHSAAITAVFPTFADAVAAFMTWPLASAAAATAAAGGADGQMAGWGGATRCYPPAMQAAATTSPDNSNSNSGDRSWGAGSTVETAEAAFGVFQNHPNQGCYIPSLPQLTVLAFKPRLGRLGPQQKQLVTQLLQGAAGRQDGQVPGSQQHLQGQHQSLGKLHCVLPDNRLAEYWFLQQLAEVL
jgi:hypothetical protein